MPFLNKSQDIASELKSKITIDSIFESIKTNTALEGARLPLVPFGKASPYMVIGDEPSTEDVDVYFSSPSGQKQIESLCVQLGAAKTDFYCTHILKYPSKERLNSLGKKFAQTFLHKEIFAVSPEIIFIVGDYAHQIFQKTFIDADINQPIQRAILTLRVNGIDLEYETYVAVVPPDMHLDEQIKSIASRLAYNQKFVHLHCHNSLSLKDGVGSPQARIKWHAVNKKPAIATSNHGNISDWYKILEGAQANGMKAILGMEAYFNRYAEDMGKAIGDDSSEAVQIKKRLRSYNRHVTMFAKNETGFFNLLKIHNDAWLNRFYRVPICSPNTIEKNHEGVLVLSGCANGEQNKIITDKYFLQSEQHKADVDMLVQNKIKSMTTLINTKNDARASEDEYLDEHDMEYFYSHQTDKKLNREEYEAFARSFIAESDTERIQTADKRIREIIDWWHNLFGDDYYLEVMVIDYPPQRIINEELIKIAKEKNIPVVITNDCHYLTKQEAEIQQLQMLSDQEKTFEDLEEDEKSGAHKIWTIKSREFYYKSVDELHASWEKWCKSDIFTEDEFWKAIKNTISIVDKIDTWKLDKSVKLPKLPESGKDVLIRKCAEGMKKYNLIGKKEYEDRLKYELNVIIKKGYVDYFLIVEDIVSWVKNNFGRLAVGPGRGCFVPDTKIRMDNNEFKPISDIQLGDKVISGWGNKRIVKNKFEYDVDEKLINVKLKNGDSISCTDNHEILVIPKNKERIIENAIWKKASELENGDVVIKNI